MTVGALSWREHRPLRRIVEETDDGEVTLECGHKSRRKGPTSHLRGEHRGMRRFRCEECEPVYEEPLE